MRDELWLAAERSGGILTRREALRLASRSTLDDAVAAGLLVRAFPSTYVLSDRHQQRDVLARAALRYRTDVLASRTGPPARPPGLSHLDALSVWELPCSPLPVTGAAAVPIHVAEGPGPAVRVAGIEVHRRQDFATMPLWEVGRDKIVVVSAAQAIVESWPLLPGRDQRSPLIVGLRDRRVRPDDISAVLDRQPFTPGAGEMRTMTQLVAGGLHSHLELWGHAHVFGDPRLPRSKPQHKVTLRGGRNVYLDRYYEELMVDVELDGAAYHGLPGQRERDLRRDAALAALGILVVRYSHQRLHGEPGAVIEELVQVLAVRRRQLGVG